MYESIHLTNPLYKASILVFKLPHYVKPVERMSVGTYQKLVHNWLADTGREKHRQFLLSDYALCFVVIKWVCVRVTVMWRCLRVRAVYVCTCALYESSRAPETSSVRKVFSSLKLQVFKILLKKVFFTPCKFSFNFPCLLYCLWLYWLIFSYIK